MQLARLTRQRHRGIRHVQRAHQAARERVATVVGADWVCPGMRRLRLRSEGIDRSWFAGDRVLVRVADAVRRYYTIARVDHARRELEILAVAHSYGAGGRWVAELEAGEVTTLFGPKPDLDVEVGDAQEVVLLGDETTVGLFEAVLSCRQRPRIIGALEHGAAVELGSESLSALTGLTRFPRDEKAPGAGLHAWAHSIVDPHKRQLFFVSGHGAAVRSLRLSLLSWGVRGFMIRSRAYWGRG